MMIEVSELGKCYRLGSVGAKSLREEFETLWKRRSAKAPAAGKNFWALRDVSFSVEQGEVLGVVGRNGAGKSTLLKLLSRITEPTEGKAILRGRVASLLEVGTGFHPELSGRENIFLNGAILGMTRREVLRKFDEIVDFAGVEKFLDTPVKRYSSGMWVRLGFAVAAHLEPEILIVDEVLAVGDAAFQAKCIGKMSEVSKEGRTIFFVSHQMPMIQRLCPRSLWLQGGQVVADGPTSEIVPQYLSQTNVKEAGPSADLTDVPRDKPSYGGLRRIEMRGEDGRLASRLEMGGTFSVRVEFECENEVQDIGLGLGIEDSAGQRLMTVSNYLMSRGQSVSGRSGVVEFRIPELRLLPGRYWLSLSLVASRQTYVDRCDRCFGFSVDPHDVFGTGQVPASHQGVTYSPAEVNLSLG